MWKSLTLNKENQAFYLKIDEQAGKSTETKYRVFVTNYVKLWFGEFDNNKLLKLMLDSNRGIEASDEGFLKICLQMLHQPNHLDKTEFLEDDKGHLTVKFILKKGIVFKMSFTLNVCSAEHFFDTVTRPLLTVVHDLRRSETELRHYLEDIRVYLRKIPADLLMRFEKLKTEEYNDERHMKTHNAMEDLLGNTADSFDPNHILKSTPISLLPYNMIRVKEENDPADPGSSKPGITVKSEPDVPPNTELKNPVKEERNTATIKTESNDFVYTPCALKRRRSSESNGATSAHVSSNGPISNVSLSDDAVIPNDTPNVPSSPVSNTSLPGLIRARCSPKERRKKLNY